MKLHRKGSNPICQVHFGTGELENMEYLTFPGLEKTGGIRQLFTTRMGGVSEGVFSTMNLSFTRGDDPAHVLENYRRAAGILECRLEDIVCSDQTHTTNVRLVTKEDGGKGVIKDRDYTDVDGLITNEPGLVLATFYADCVPLYFVDPVHKAIGLSHSGWRGTVNRMGQRTIEAMAEHFGTEPKDLHVAIGPSICRDCYEVSEDVIDAVCSEFSSKYWRELFYAKENGKYQLDLWAVNKLIFMEAGVPKENIEVTDLCTCCNPEYLFSHRASHGRRGNLAAFLKLCQNCII